MIRLILSIFFIAILSFASIANDSDGKKTAKTTIVGHVCDVDSHEPLEGTKVIVKELQLVLYTDANGNFSFQGMEGAAYNYSLQYISYDKLTLAQAADDNVLFFEMKEID